MNLLSSILRPTRGDLAWSVGVSFPDVGCLVVSFPGPGMWDIDSCFVGA